MALKEAWDGSGFRCFYTGVILDEKNSKSPKYLSFDHKTPRCEDEMVVTCALMNDMKTDMSDAEFRRVVIELANHFGGHPFDATVLQLRHWKRA